MVRSRSMAGFDAPYRPGWDCHGLPIELQVDKNLGAKKKEMGPVAFRKECRAYAEKFLAIQRTEFERLGILGEWQDPYLTMAPSYQASIVRELATFAEKGLVYKAKKSVHWCISCRTALAEAEVEYDEQHKSPSIDVKFALSEADAKALATEHPALAGKKVYGVIWTTTPWTLPANLGIAFHPDFEYAFFPVLGTDEVLILARDMRELVEKRWRRDDLKLGEPLAVAKGTAFERRRFRHPFIARDSLGVLADYVTKDSGTGLVHTAPGHGCRRLPHRRPLRARHLLPGGRSGPLPSRGRALRRQEGLRREPGDRRVPPQPGRARPGGHERALLSALLALQAPDHLPGHGAVVHRPRWRGSPPREDPARDHRGRSGSRPGARSASPT